MTPEELEDHAETLELVNSELAARLGRQAGSTAKIDTKAIALAGYAVVAASFLATQHPQPVLAGLAYAAYVAALGLSIFAYAIGSHRDVPDPRRLLNGYALRPKPEVLAALAAERVKAFEINAGRQARRVRFWRASLIALAVGVTLMVVSIVVQTGHHDSTTRPGHADAYFSAGPAAHR
jgi:hypothetical protein